MLWHLKNIESPTTRRRYLSPIASVFDPLGFIAPYLLRPKKDLQLLCKTNKKRGKKKQPKKQVSPLEMLTKGKKQRTRGSPNP
jgi:hypothetical protein